MSSQSLKLNQEKDIPEGWEKVEIGDHFNFKNGLNKAKKFFGQGTPIINYMDVYPHPAIHEKDIHGKVTVSNDELRSFGIKKGDVLFTRTSETIEEIGLSSVILDDVEKTVFSGFLLRSRPKTELFELEFKKYCFRSKNARRQIISTSSQTTRALTNGKLLSKISVLIPLNPQEQKNIAESISDVEKIIDKLEKILKKKKNIKQGVLQELLSGKRKLQEFNGEWVNKKLKDITREIRDGTHQTPIYVKNGVPFYSVENITDDNFVDTKYISKKEHQKLTKSFKIEKGDILMTRIGSIGDCKLIDWNADASFYVSLALLKLNDDVSSEFIYQYSKSSLFKKELEIGSLQWAVPKKINLKNISDISIHIPICKEEQSVIAKILSDMDSEIQELEQKRDKYIAIKDGMMQKLLTGEIRLV